MAKVYEAMLLSREQAPDATKQFLTEYNFSEVMPDPYASFDEDDPLDLAALGLLPNGNQGGAAPVHTDVAIAEAIAESVSTLATSFTTPPWQPVVAAPPVPMTATPTPKDLVPAAYRAEFRQLGAIVMRTATQRTLQAVVICGIDPQDRADFVLENLALALAENPALRIARFCLLSPSAAFVPTPLASNFQIKIHRTALPNLCEVVSLHGLLPIGQLLRECDIEKMLEMLKQRFDFVLLETDAINWTDEVAAFAGKADGVILVAQKETMRGPAMSTARQKLHDAGAQVLGAVVNRNCEQEQLQRVA